MTVEDQIEALQKSATWEFHMAAAKSSGSKLDEARAHAHKAYNALDLIAALTIKCPPGEDRENGEDLRSVPEGVAQ